MGVVIEFCGEVHPVVAGRRFTIGRQGDLVIDDNPFLHRRFLEIDCRRDLWWLANVGSQLAATVADEAGTVQTWLAPGASIPLVFARSTVWFTAGPTTYELDLHCDDPPFAAVGTERAAGGETTCGRASLTPEQRLLLVALAEPMLRQRGRGAVDTPTSAQAAERLGWAVTKFNRKLDYVCQKLEKQGVRGLHGGPDRLARDRKARLVEYALATRLVVPADVDLLGGRVSP